MFPHALEKNYYIQIPSPIHQPHLPHNRLGLGAERDKNILKDNIMNALIC